MLPSISVKLKKNSHHSRFLVVPRRAPHQPSPMDIPVLWTSQSYGHPSALWAALFYSRIEASFITTTFTNAHRRGGSGTGGSGTLVARCRATIPPDRLRHATWDQPACAITLASACCAGHSRIDSARYT